MGIFSTEQSDKKRHVLACDDNLRRVGEIALFIDEKIRINSVKIICSEAISYPRNAGAAAKVALCFGAIGCIAKLTNTPIVQASPQEVKKRLCGKKDASKEDVERAVKAKYDLSKFLVGVRVSLHNHAFDALASAITCFDSDAVVMARRLSK